MAYLKISGEVGYDITLYSIVSAVQDLKKAGAIDVLNIDITSDGGNSAEGRQIFDYLSSLEFPVNTNAVDYVCSAGFTIFMAGQKRTAQNNMVNFLMHSPVYMAFLEFISPDDAEEIKAAVEEEKSKLIKIYSEKLGIEKETISALMDKDEMISADTAQKLGIISDVIIKEVEKPQQFNIAAKFYTSDKHKLLILNYNKMEKTDIEKLNGKVEEQQSFLTKIWNAIKGKIKNISIAADDGQMLEINEDVLEVGSTCSNVTEGTFVVTYMDKKYTIVIAEGVVTEMTEVVEEPPAPTQEEVDNLKAEISELKRQLGETENLKNKLAENEEYVSKLRKITSKYEKEDGTFDFTGKTTTTEKTEESNGKSIANEVRAKREKK